MNPEDQIHDEKCEIKVGSPSVGNSNRPNVEANLDESIHQSQNKPGLHESPWLADFILDFGARLGRESEDADQDQHTRDGTDHLCTLFVADTDTIVRVMDCSDIVLAHALVWAPSINLCTELLTIMIATRFFDSIARFQPIIGRLEAKFWLV